MPGMFCASKLMIQKHTTLTKHLLKGKNHCKSGTYCAFNARHALLALSNLQKDE